MSKHCTDFWRHLGRTSFTKPYLCPTYKLTSGQAAKCTLSLCQDAAVPILCRTVCAEDRERIARAYNDGGDNVAVARQLNIQRTTAWLILALLIPLSTYLG